MVRLIIVAMAGLCLLWTRPAYAENGESAAQIGGSDDALVAQETPAEDAPPSEEELDLGIATPDALIEPGQVQFGFEVGYARDRSGGVTATCWEAPVTWRVGISERANLEFGWDGFVRERSSGVTTQGAGDFPVGVRIGLPSASISHALGLYAIIPSGEADFGSDGLGMALDYAWGHENASEDFWYGQVGVSAVNPRGPGGLDWALGYNMNVDIPVSDLTVLTLSLEGESPLDPGGRTGLAAGAGLTFTLDDDPGVEVGIGISRGLTNAADDWGAAIGLGVRWK